MTFEKIKALAAEEGLNPKRLVLRESFFHSWGAREYTFEYSENQRRYGYNFLLTPDDPEEIAVEFYVAMGFRALRKKIEEDGEQAKT